jgi:hypothetical protein
LDDYNIFFSHHLVPLANAKAQRKLLFWHERVCIIVTLAVLAGRDGTGRVRIINANIKWPKWVGGKRLFGFWSTTPEGVRGARAGGFKPLAFERGSLASGAVVVYTTTATAATRVRILMKNPAVHRNTLLLRHTLMYIHIHILYIWYKYIYRKYTHIHIHIRIYCVHLTISHNTYITYIFSTIWKGEKHAEFSRAFDTIATSFDWIVKKIILKNPLCIKVCRYTQHPSPSIRINRINRTILCWCHQILFLCMGVQGDNIVIWSRVTEILKHVPFFLHGIEN